MLGASIVTLLIPLWIILGLLLIIGVLGALARIQNGRYLRPLVQLIAKVPLFRRWLEKGQRAAIERTNPELASAMRKLEPHAKQLHDPQQAQKVMSRLTREERAALLEMQEQQGSMPEEATNRQMRRQLEKQRKRR
ncbi:MAG TPA: hypothetical protein VFU64_03360 [Gaiellaceae bacterium]|nr:hypothetical protein [Gaiellaceae bacterium]